ncbi:hypothetical protein Tco_0756378 [Tanacetum coccineum]
MRKIRFQKPSNDSHKMDIGLALDDDDGVIGRISLDERFNAKKVMRGLRHRCGSTCRYSTSLIDGIMVIYVIEVF